MSDPPTFNQPAPGPADSSGGATASLVLGICGLAVCPLICSVLALVFGYNARRAIDRSNGTLTGRGNATAGIVLGWVGVALVIAFALLIVGLAVTGNLDDSSTSPTGTDPLS